MKSLTFILVGVATIVQLMGFYHLYNLAHHTVADSSSNWYMVAAELTLGFIGAIGVAVYAAVAHSPETTAETETVDQLFLRAERRARQDLAHKLTGGVS